LEGARRKLLILAGPSTANGGVVEMLRAQCDVVETSSIEQAIVLAQLIILRDLERRAERILVEQEKTGTERRAA
jgi:hypothetical protein